MRVVRTALRIVVWAGAAVPLSGCTQWNLRGDGYPAEVQAMTSGYRPTESANTPAGVSQKARDIEKNFGVGK